MAIIQCPGCGSNISDQAVQCPKCGCQIQNNTCQFQGSTAIPNEIKKWNWGAFFFNWIWGACHGIYWTLAIIIVNIIPYIGGFITLGLCIYLGFKGNELAWKAKPWPNVSEFLNKQRKWAIAAAWVFIASVIICFFVGFIIGINEAMY